MHTSRDISSLLRRQSACDRCGIGAGGWEGGVGVVGGDHVGADSRVGIGICGCVFVIILVVCFHSLFHVAVVGQNSITKAPSCSSSRSSSSKWHADR